MKTREIEVWVTPKPYSRNQHYVYWPDEPTPQNAIKAKLVVPAEPEVLEFEIDGTEEIGYLAPAKILAGRRWKIVATEIIENESLNLK